MNGEVQDTSKRKCTNLFYRVVIGAAAGPLIFFGTIFSFQVFLSLLLILIVFALKEIYRLIRVSGEAPLSSVGWIYGLAIVLACVFYGADCLYYVLFFGVFIFGAGIIISQGGSGVFGAVLTFFWTTYISAGAGSLVFIYIYNWGTLTGGEPAFAGGRIVSFILLLVWTLDTSAYFIGRRFGRRPIAYTISPKKSMEGAVGGFGCTILMAALAHFVYVSFLPLYHILAIGGIVGITGQVGDLVISAFKRKAQIKDSSSAIPGHGGVLDRFDSLFLSAPFVYFYVYFVF